MDLNNIAYCGVDCAACPDRLDQTCPGCRESEWPEGGTCLPVACCRQKAIAFCGNCAQFPCEDMQGFYEESDSHQQAYVRMRLLHDGMD